MSGPSDRNPYVGPRPIQQGEPLYGRRTEVRELFNLLKARRIVVLHSPSGAGKSSLVQAGLIPRLKDGKFDVWKPIRVNLDPRGLEGVPKTTNRYLLSAMLSLEEELPAERRRGPAQLAGLDFAEYLKSRPRRKHQEGSSVVLIFDQFEELLTTAPRAVADKEAFFSAVGGALEAGDYWALFIVREDYLGAFAPYRDRIPTHLANTFRLDLLGLDGAREAAEQPALAAGRTFPAVDKLIADLAMVRVQQADGRFVTEQGLYVEPVQLQVVCRRLWDAMPRDDLSIEEKDIAAYASVSEALGSYYADAVRTIAAGELAVERALRTWVGQKLIVGGIRSQVRQEVGKSAGLDNRLITRLLDSYLVRTEQRAGAHWFELSHDRLVEPVQKNDAAWEKTHLHPVQVQAKLWEDARRSGALLLGSEALRDAQAWAKDNPTLLTEGEREFLERSREQRAKKHKARLRLVVLTILAVISGVVATVFGGVAAAERDRAEASQIEALAQRDMAQRAEASARQAEAEAVDQGNVAKAARAAAEQARRENERLLQDMFLAALRGLIDNLARDLPPSSEIVVDERWTPLLQRDGQCFVASTILEGGGRIIVAGHDAVLSAATTDGFSVFLEMTSKRLITDRGPETGPVVILSDRNDPALAQLAVNLDKLQYTHLVNPPLHRLASASMLILANRHTPFSPEESATIEAFIRRGGGVLAVGVGWAWLARTPAAGEATPTLANYPMNQILGQFGVQWSDHKIQAVAPAIAEDRPVGPAAPQVTLYANSKFSGVTERIRPGAYDHDDLGRIGDDQLSSLKVPAGLQVTLFEQPNFTGRKRVLTADTPKLGDLDDRCSAIEVTALEKPPPPGPTINLAFAWHGGSCPAGARLVTHTEALADPQRLCQLLDPWLIVRLANGRSMDGPAYGCKIQTNVDNQAIRDLLCVPNG